MTPRELFDAGPIRPQWIHGGDIGVDEKGGLWVRADATLKSDLGMEPGGAIRVTTLAAKDVTVSFREYSILTPDRKTGLDPRHRSEPLWKRVHELKSESIGTEWVAVN